MRSDSFAKDGSTQLAIGGPYPVANASSLIGGDLRSDSFANANPIDSTQPLVLREREDEEGGRVEEEVGERYRDREVEDFRTETENHKKKEGDDEDRGRFGRENVMGRGMDENYANVCYDVQDQQQELHSKAQEEPLSKEDSLRVEEVLVSTLLARQGLDIKHISMPDLNTQDERKENASSTNQEELISGEQEIRQEQELNLPPEFIQPSCSNLDKGKEIEFYQSRGDQG